MGASGTTTLDFGAAPGSTDTSVIVTGQSSIVSGSRVEAWLEVPAGGTADHTSDEHWVENLNVFAGNIAVGVGFTIYAKCNLGLTQGQFQVAWVWL